MTTRKAASEPSLQRDDRDEGRSQLDRLRAAIMARPARRDYLRRIPVRNRATLIMVPTSQVSTIVAHGERLTITTRDHHRHTFACRLKDLEGLLDPAEFIRLGRGAIVNVNAVSRLVAGPNGTNKAIIDDGEELGMSRLQSRRLRHVLLRLLRYGP
jgi:DNA-binding LytR/AlgR family response regulator